MGPMVVATQVTQVTQRRLILGDKAVCDGICMLCGRPTAAGNRNVVTLQWDGECSVPLDASSYFNTCSPEHQRELADRLYVPGTRMTRILPQ